MPLVSEAGRHLQFGLTRVVPPEVRAAWGARWIVTQRGEVDQLPDRQSMFYETETDRDALLDVLNGGVGVIARQQCAVLLMAGRMQTRVAQDMTLYEDRRIRVAANTNASAGYCYVAAWLKDWNQVVAE